MHVQNNTTYISIQYYITSYIILYTYIPTYSSCLHLYFGKFLKHPVQPSMEWWSIYCYSRVERGCNQLVFLLYSTKRALPLLYIVTHSPKTLMYWGYNRTLLFLIGRKVYEMNPPEPTLIHVYWCLGSKNSLQLKPYN